MIKTKKKFSERWTNQFVNKFNGIVAILSGYFLKRDEFDEFHVEVFDYLFALARAAKVTPAQFAKLIDINEGPDYGCKVLEALVKLREKAAEKAAKEVARADKKAGQRA